MPLIFKYAKILVKITRFYLKNLFEFYQQNYTLHVVFHNKYKGDKVLHLSPLWFPYTCRAVPWIFFCLFDIFYNPEWEKYPLKRKKVINKYQMCRQTTPPPSGRPCVPFPLSFYSSVSGEKTPKFQSSTNLKA